MIIRTHIKHYSAALIITLEGVTITNITHSICSSHARRKTMFPSDTSTSLILSGILI